jgi:hypothetical protein
MHPDDLLRLVNAVLALMCAVGYAHTRIWRGRQERSAEETMLRFGIVIVLFAVSWGSAEAMARGNELVWAQFMLTFGYVAIQVGLWATRPWKREDRP